MVIIASGPSLAWTDLSLIPADWQTMTVNSAWEKLPDANHHYAGDYAWWLQYVYTCRSTGTRWTWDSKASDAWGINRLVLHKGRGLCEPFGHVNHGGNSGFQAINLAYHLGATRIVLLGFDMSRKHGAHFHGDHPQGMVNAPHQHIICWRKHMAHMAADLSKAGIQCVNASEYTELDCFPQVKMPAAFL